jgi:phosphatidate cytidylyltransferase
MLKQRVMTALVLIPLLIVALFVLPRDAGAIAIGLLFLGGAVEWGGFFGDGSHLQRSVFTLVVLGVLAVVFMLAADHGFLRLLTGLAMLMWVAALILVVRYPLQIARPVTAATGVAVLVCAGASLMRLHLDWQRGPELLLFLFILVWAADIGAYFTGRTFGRVKLAPAVSPGKTWEGVAGGMLLALLAALAGSYWFGFGAGWFLPLCVVAAVISVVGDLTVSIFKRNAGLKDSGRIFPGHGGILDRVDSITAAGPVFVFGLLVAGI